MTVALSDVSVAYCDSVEVLKRAWEEGLPRNARIRTGSPAVYYSGIGTVEPLEASARPVNASEYWNCGSGLTRDAYQALSAHSDTAAIALLGARAMLAMHRMLQKATRLDADDFAEPRAALLVDTPSRELDALFNAPWPAFFAEHDRYIERRYAVSIVPQPLTAETPLRLRLRQVDWARLLYFVGVRLKGSLAALTGRRVLIFKENELVEDAVCALMGHGYAPQRVSGVSSKTDVDMDLLNRSEAVLRPTVDRFLDRWFVSHVHGAARRMAREELSRVLGIHAASRSAWRDQLRRHKSRRTILITNFPGGPEGIALAETCREMNIPFVVAQHGVTREISDTHGPIEVLFENGTSDLFLTFNDRAKVRTEASAYSRGRVQTVGLPRAYHRLSSTPRLNKDCPVLYISTALLKGNINLATGGASDIDRIARERAIVNDVLARLPRKVLYKTYPSDGRYVDADPLHEVLARHPNVDVFHHHVDLRYFIREHEILVASRATSTISWCLMARRPLVYIDFPDDAPLSPDARAAFEAGVFVFEWADPGMLEKLRAFLSRPIDAIRSDWLDKAPDRDRLIRDFITAYPAGAGRRSAVAILDEMRNGSGRADPALRLPRSNPSSPQATHWTK